MAARDGDARPPRRSAHLEHIDADLLVDAVTLAGDLLVARHQRLFRALQVQGYALRPNRLDRPDDDLAFLAAEAVVLILAFGLTEPLDDDLLGRLRGDAPEVTRRYIHHNPLSQGNIAVQPPGLRVGDLHDGIFDRPILDDFLFQVDVSITAFHIDVGGDILFRIEAPVPPVGGDQGRADGVQHDIPREIVLRADLIKGKRKITLHRRPFLRLTSSFSLAQRLLQRKVGSPHFSASVDMP